jgi:hypothetical protein
MRRGSCLAFWPSLCLSRDTFSGSPGSFTVPGIASVANCRSSVVELFPKRLSPLLTLACFQYGPFAPRELPHFLATMSRSDSHRRPSYVMDSAGKLKHRCLTTVGLPGSWTDLSMRAVPYHPEEFSGRLSVASPPMAGFIHIGRTGHSHRVTRPNRVRLRYGSHIRCPRLRFTDYSAPRSLATC